MKTVTIPTCANPFVVIVNGIKYTYPAGATVEVPDDVAAVIEQHDEAHNNPEPAPVVPPFVPSTGGGGGGLPVVELTTAVTAEPSPLTAEENALMDAVAETGNPIILKCSGDGGYFCGLATAMGESADAIIAFYLNTPDTTLIVMNQGNGWMVMEG